MTWIRSAANGLGLVALLAVGGVIAHTAPSDARWQQPLEVRGHLGDVLTGRNIEATVHDVRLAETVSAGNGWTGETPGTWVVADISAEAVVDEFAASMQTTQLRIDGVTYGATERAGLGSLDGAALSLGIPTSGPLFFEVPTAVLQSDSARHAEILLGISSDPRLDSMLVVDVDLSTLRVESSIDTEDSVWGQQ